MNNFVAEARAIIRENGKLYDLTSPSPIMFYTLVGGFYHERQISSLFQNKYDKFVFVDVGACVGAWSFSMYKRFPNSIFYCFEPCLDTFQHLVRNMDGAKARFYQLAIGDSEEEVTLQLPTEEEYAGERKNSYWRLEGNYGALSKFGGSGRCKIVAEQKKLDDIVPFANIIKIDVEGMERFVLRGAERILRESRPFLQIELNEINQKRSGYSTGELIKDIESYNYYYAGLDQADGIFIPSEALT